MIRPRLPLAIGMTALPTLASPAPAFAQDMIDNLPDCTGAWVKGDLMQRRGRSGGDKAERKPEPQAILAKQATYMPAAAVRSKADSAFAGYFAGQQVASSPVLLRALVADSPPGSAFTRLLAAELGGSEAAIRGRLRQGQLQGDYGRWLTSMGYRSPQPFEDQHARLTINAAA